MKKSILALVCTAVCLICSCSSGNGGKYVEVSGYTQGVKYSVKFNTQGLKISPEQAAHAIDSILICIDTTLSGFNPGSMLSRYNRGEKITPNWLMKDIMNRAREVYEISGHTVDVTSAPLFDLWGFGFSENEEIIPSDEQLKEAMAACGMNNFNGDLTQAAKGQKLNFNAIGQGYTCDLIAGFLYGIGAKNMLVDVGEIYVDGLNPSGKNWTIGIDTPSDDNAEPGTSFQGIWTSDGKSHGIVTSGNYRKFFVKDGQKYSHTIDPRTGRPVQHNLLSATVLAEDACTADAYSTACMVLGLEAAKEFVIDKGMEAYLIYDEGGKMCTWSSPGFNVTDQK